MKTVSLKPSEVSKEWLIIDAGGQPLGRMASQIAYLLRGKHKPTFTPHVDGGDYVVVINAAQVSLSGGKWDKKMYYRHSGFVGGLKSFTARELLEKKPESLVQLAVKGMLARNKMRDRLLGHLKVYPGSEHPHQGQRPKVAPPRLASVEN